jgi:hypothetical protein
VASTVVPDLEPIRKLREELALIEEKVVTGYTLADAIREGSRVSGKLVGDAVRGASSCALGAGWIAAQARGFIPGGQHE